MMERTKDYIPSCFTAGTIVTKKKEPEALIFQGFWFLKADFCLFELKRISGFWLLFKPISVAYVLYYMHIIDHI